MPAGVFLRNSLSQSLAALPAPSGREPLALPETLPSCQRPHPRGGCRRRRLGEFLTSCALSVIACGSTPSVTACAVPAPPRGRLRCSRKVCHHRPKPSPWTDFPRPGRDVSLATEWGAGGCERSEQTEGVHSGKSLTGKTRLRGFSHVHTSFTRLLLSVLCGLWYTMVNMGHHGYTETDRM